MLNKGVFMKKILILIFLAMSCLCYLPATNTYAYEISSAYINNISSAEQTLSAGQAYYLTPPTITITQNDTYGYIGLAEDGNTSLYYEVKTLSATSSDYSIEDNTYFTANTQGIYKLQYIAYLLEYKKSEVAETATGGKLFFCENTLGQKQLKYYDGTNEYFVYLDEENNYNLKVTANLDGTGASINASTIEALVKGYVIESEAFNLEVHTPFISILSSKTTSYYDTYYELKQKIEIIKPFCEFNGNTEIDLQNSTVTITKNAQTLAIINLKDWDKTSGIEYKDYFEISNGGVYLIFQDDAKYTISYDVKATVGDGDKLSVSMYAGDVFSPSLEIGKSFIRENYFTGECLEISFNQNDLSESFLTISDDNTTLTNLLKNLTIQLTHNDSTITLQNITNLVLTHKYQYYFEKAGTYTLTVSVVDDANNKTSKQVNFEVYHNLSYAIIDGLEDKIYTGKEITQTINLKLGSEIISPTLYDISYINNINSGHASIIIEGNGIYKGQILIKTFSILKAKNEWIQEYNRYNWIEGATPGKISPPISKFGTSIITYYTDKNFTNKYLGNIENLPAGTYYVRVEVLETENYCGLCDNYSFIVKSEQPEFNLFSCLALISSIICLLTTTICIITLFKKAKNNLS